MTGQRKPFQSEAEEGGGAPPFSEELPPPPPAFSSSSSTENSSTAPCVPTALANTVPSLEKTASLTSTPGEGGGSKARSFPEEASKNETKSASLPTAMRFSLFLPGHHAREMAAQRGAGLGGVSRATKEDEEEFEEDEFLEASPPVRASKSLTEAPSSEATARISGSLGCHASLLTRGGRALGGGGAAAFEVEALGAELGSRISATGLSWF